MKSRSLPFDPASDQEVSAWFTEHSTTELAGEEIDVVVDPEAIALQTITPRLDVRDME